MLTCLVFLKIESFSGDECEWNKIWLNKSNLKLLVEAVNDKKRKMVTLKNLFLGKIHLTHNLDLRPPTKLMFLQNQFVIIGLRKIKMYYLYKEQTSFKKYPKSRFTTNRYWFWRQICVLSIKVQLDYERLKFHNWSI